MLLHLVFRDVEGALAVITSALAASGVNVRRVAAFCASDVAIDTFQLDAFTFDAESCLMEQLSAHLSEIEGESTHSGAAWQG